MNEQLERGEPDSPITASHPGESSERHEVRGSPSPDPSGADSGTDESVGESDFQEDTTVRR